MGVFRGIDIHDPDAGLAAFGLKGSLDLQGTAIIRVGQNFNAMSRLLG